MIKRLVLSHSLASTAGRTLQTGGNGRWTPPPPGSRSAEQIRNDIVQQRSELSRSVDALRNRWVQVTDVAPPDQRAPDGARRRRGGRRLPDRRSVALSRRRS